MKKIYIKYKILVNGLSTTTEYNIDGFTLKKSCFEKAMFDIKYNEQKNGVDVNTNYYLLSCVIDSEKLIYNYFESDNYEEIEIPKDTIIDIKMIEMLLQTKKEILNRTDYLERKLRIVLNIPLLFQTVCIEFYDDNKKFLCTMQGDRQMFSWNRLAYNIDPKEFTNNSRFHVNFNSMQNTNNIHFNRALEFYNDSFESEKLSNRYILIFSSLEAIFNLDAKKIKQNLAKYSAKLLAEDNHEEYKKIYSDIRKLYKKRCDYVHGLEMNNILESDEKLLRYYVRKIIIAYWIIILRTQKSSKEILEYLDSGEKLDLQVRLFISTINSKNFSEQQHKLVDIVEKELGRPIPSETKNFLYSECDKDV